MGYKVTEEGLGQARLSTKMRLLGMLARAGERGRYWVMLGRSRGVDLILPSPVLPEAAPSPPPVTPELAAPPTAPLAPTTEPKAPRLRAGMIYVERAPTDRLG